MGRFGKISKLITGIMMILFSIFLVIFTSQAYSYICLVLSITLLVYGIRMIVYYFSMARHMVGGKSFLFIGVIIIDLGLFTLTLYNIPTEFLVLYLVISYLFYCLVDILRAFEQKRFDSKEWKLKFANGIVDFLIAASALVFGIIMKSEIVAIYIYAFGLVYSGIANIISAIRKGEVVYIQQL